VVGESDLLVHVVDAAAPDPGRQIEAVHAVLAEIEADRVPEVLALNKIDLVRDELDRLRNAYPGAIVISAHTGEGITELLGTVADRLRAGDRVVELTVPYARADVLAALRREGEVMEESYDTDSAHLRARLDEAGTRRYAEFMV
jgi:GTPase